MITIPEVAHHWRMFVSYRYIRTSDLVGVEWAEKTGCCSGRIGSTHKSCTQFNACQYESTFFDKPLGPDCSTWKHIRPSFAEKTRSSIK